MINDKEGDSENALIKFAKPIASKINEGAEKTRTLFSSSSCIFRVPKDLRELNESAYVPRLIAIGPLHCKDEHLQTPMQHVKMHYTDLLLYKLAKYDKEKALGKKKLEVLQNCVKEMKKCVERAKRCYAEEVPLVENGTVEEEMVEKEVVGKKMTEMVKKEVEKKMKETMEKEMVKKEVEKEKEEMVEEAEKEMVEMMLVDGCFILNLLYSSYHSKNIPPGGDGGNSKASSHGGEDGSTDQGGRVDPILECIINRSIINHDLLLLENQIPFFVLESLFELTLKKIILLDPIMRVKNPSLKDLVLDYFQDIMCLDGDNSECKNDKNCLLSTDCVLWVNESCFRKETQSGEERPRKENGYHHILHFLHEHYIPQPCDPPLEKPASPGICCHSKRESTANGICCLSKREVFASDLDYAGVKFVPMSKGNLFDVQFIEPKWPFWLFRSARFQIPTLDIHDPTETLFRNLIALEQCCPMVDLYFTAYAKFIDKLIDSEKDVKVLTKAKVIRNHLGADVDVSDLFNKLCKQIVTPKDFYFNDKCEAAYKYSQYCWPKFRAHVRRTYIDCPWRSVGFLVAILAFIITVWEFVLALQ